MTALPNFLPFVVLNSYLPCIHPCMCFAPSDYGPRWLSTTFCLLLLLVTFAPLPPLFVFILASIYRNSLSLLLGSPIQGRDEPKHDLNPAGRRPKRRSTYESKSVAADVSSDPTQDSFQTEGNVDEHTNTQQRFPPATT